MKKSIAISVIGLILLVLTAAEAFAQARVKINLDSNVRGADVYIDGRLAGKIPFSGVVAAGRHTIKVSAEGYYDAEDSFTFRNDTTFTMELKAKERRPVEPDDFSLNIDSNVRGAKIFLDNKYVGDAPATVRVAKGNHNLKVTADGYIDYVTGINIRNDTTMTAELQRAQRFYNLSISVKIPGAKIYINDKHMGSGAIRQKLPEGEYTIKVVAFGFIEFTQTIRLDRDVSLSPNLEKERRFYALSIAANAPEAKVWINDREEEGFAPLTVKLEEGTYKIKVRSRGYRSYETTVVLNRDTRIDARLAVERAKIIIDLPEAIAKRDRGRSSGRIEVYLDGKRQKGFEFEVERGRHVVRIESGSWYVEDDVNVREGRVYRLSPKFILDVSEEEN